MMIPTSYLTALLLTVVSMLCWGSWANTAKMTGKWRFELFYFDYSFGVFLAAVVAAFTFGSYGPGGGDTPATNFGFLENMDIAARGRMFLAFASGGIFNLANMLLVAAITVAGLSVAFPVGIGLALIIGVLLNFWLKPKANGNPYLLFAGVALVLAAIIVTAMAHSAHQKSKMAPPDESARRDPRHQRKSPFKGIVLSLAAGLLMGLFYPILEYAKMGDFGVGPYSAAFLFSLGVLLSTFFFNLFFMNLPVEGPPVGFRDYFAGTARQHLLGVLGGVIWSIGAITNFLAASAPQRVQVGGAVSYAIGQGAALVSTLWGLLLWKEFAGSTSKVNAFIVLLLILFASGLALVSMAPLFPQ
ncbi:MAG: multidrug DMT transporter permease [Bryobacterales bacterium]|nr:multidrug DMT transporter permease [Bryobacterales bacterium]